MQPHGVVATPGAEADSQTRTMTAGRRHAGVGRLGADSVLARRFAGIAKATGTGAAAITIQPFPAATASNNPTSVN